MMIGQRMACNRQPHPDSPPSKINSKTEPIPLRIHPMIPQPTNSTNISKMRPMIITVVIICIFYNELMKKAFVKLYNEFPEYA